MTMGTGGIFGVPYGSRRKRGGLFDPRLETPDSVEMAPPLGSDFDEEDPKKGLLGYWQGGDKFTWKDAGAGLLAVVGDAFARENDDEGSAVSNLTGGRVKAMAEAKAAQKQEMIAAAMRAKGLSDADIQLAMLNPEAVGTNAAKKLMPAELPEKAQMSEWYRNATPDQRAAFDATNPIITNGYGSTVVPRSTFGAASSTAPGTIEDGYQFMGGDDKDPKNWRPVQGGPTRAASGGFRR